MYDSNVGQRKFRMLESRVSQLWYSKNNINIDKLMNDIQNALDTEKISGAQYDNLVAELSELGYDMSSN